jgi:hypothetical protein
MSTLAVFAGKANGIGRGWDQRVRQISWQAPPGWPPSPDGWAPPPGWQPDPSWPEPPAGWKFWRQEPRTRWQKVRLGLLVAVPGSVVAMLVAGEIYGAAVGCGSVDPTDPGNYSDVTIHNDMPAPVVVDECSGAYCVVENLPVRLGPGQSYEDHAACGASGGGMTSWEVKTAEGKVLGYIAVDTPRKDDGLVFNVSDASNSRTTPTAPD